jgi:excinuclease ABC subunit B
MAEIQRAGRPRRAGARHHLTKKMAEDLTDYLLEKGSGCATCTPRSTPCAASSCCASCGWASSTCWSASTCCARASTCPRCRSWSHPRRRQGGLPALETLAHPDDRPRRPQRVRPGAHVRRQASPPRCATAIDETNRRRVKQVAYNTERRHRSAAAVARRSPTSPILADVLAGGKRVEGLPTSDLAGLIQELTAQMHTAAAELHFELAARFRRVIPRPLPKPPRARSSSPSPVPPTSASRRCSTPSPERG